MADEAKTAAEQPPTETGAPEVPAAPASVAEASGAATVFHIGDEIRVGPVAFTLRAPTNPEIGLYAEISERHDFESITLQAASIMQGVTQETAQGKVLDQKRMAFEAERAKLLAREAKGEKITKKDQDRLLTLAKHLDDLAAEVDVASASTRREKFYHQKLKALQKRVAPLEQRSIEGKAKPEEEDELLTLLEEMDAIGQHIARIKNEAQHRFLRSIDSIYSTAYLVHSELTWHIAQNDGIFDGTLEEWRVITRNHAEALDDLVASMGFRSPLSGLQRQGVRSSGAKRTSTPSPPASPKRNG